MGGGQDKPAWTVCPPGVKITRVGGKITRDSLPPGGQAVQGGKINCYTGTRRTYVHPFILDYWAKTRYQPIFRHFLGAVLQYLAIFCENLH